MSRIGKQLKCWAEGGLCLSKCHRVLQCKSIQDGRNKETQNCKEGREGGREGGSERAIEF